MKKLLLALVLISTAAFAADRKLQTHQIEIKGGAGATPPTGSINLFNRNGVNRPAWKNSAGSQFFVNDFGYMTGSLVMPDPTTSSHGGVYAHTATANNFLTGIDANGVPTYAQPAYSDISGSLVIPNPSTSSHGGVYSSAAVSNQFLTGIGTDGVVTRAQPAFTDISGSLLRTQLAWDTPYAALVNNASGSLVSVLPGASGNVLQSDGTNWVSAANSAAASGSLIVASGNFVGAANCTPTVSSATLASMSDTDCTGPTIEHNNTTYGTLQTTDADNPTKFTINSLPAGLYEVNIRGNVYSNGGSPVAQFAIHDDSGSNKGLASQIVLTTGGSMFNVTGFFYYPVSGNRTFELYSAVSANSITFDMNASNTIARIYFYVKKI